MANEYYDYPDERDPDYETALERARTAGEVADQMRAEEDALLDLEGLSPRTEIGPGGTYSPPAPVMSQPIPPGAGPAIAPPSGRVIQMPQVFDPEAATQALAAQQKYEAMRMYQFLTANGMPASQALQQTGVDIFSPGMTGSATGAKPMSEYQRAQVARWNQEPELTPFQQAQVERWKRQEEATANKPDRSVASRISRLENDIRKLEADIAKNPPLKSQAFDDRTYILAKWKQELAKLRDEAMRPPAPVGPSAPPPAIAPPTAGNWQTNRLGIRFRRMP